LKKTTFVIGAGASADFNLPLGRTLAEHIRAALDDEFGDDHTSQSGRITHALGMQGYNEQDVQAARDLRGMLLRSPTIDHALYTLRARPPVVRVGKAAIAELILKGEHNSPLPQGWTNDRHGYHKRLHSCGNSWLAHLFIALLGDRSPEEFADAFDEAPFVVFNYDRCVEQYLYYALQDVGSLHQNAAKAILEKVPIAHVYGSLGRIEPLKGQKVTGFGSDQLAAAGYAAGSLRTYTEGAEDGAQAEVRRLIGWAERVVFLGFGFDPLNMKVLFPDGPIEGQAPWGTRFSIEQEDDRMRAFAETMIGNKLAAAPLLDMTCADFVQKYAKALASGP
jgi:hypothetical protein